MAGNVTTESAAVQSGIKVCDMSMNELNEASQKLARSYQQAGSGGWKDQKYAALGGIVEECCNALTKPINELASCRQKLEALLKAIQEYEQVDL